MRCRDKSLVYLQRIGYNVVRHPQEGIRPMDLIGQRKDSVRYLGGLKDAVLDPGVQLPVVETDLRASEISGQSTENVNFKLGLRILGSIFSALGGNIDVSTSYSSARKLVFRFHEVFKDRVAPLSLDGYIRQAEFNEDNLVLRPFLDDGRVLLITETVKANKFSVEATDKNGQSVEVDIPAIKEAAEGKLEISRDAERQFAVRYEGTKFLTFGFQCFEVAYTDGELRLVSTRPGTAYMGPPVSDEEENLEPDVLSDSQLLTLEMKD